MYKPGKLMVISACSGVGKTTLVNQLCHVYSKVQRVVTYTTRKPRDGELHGVDYYFIDELTFLRRIAEGFFLEWSYAYDFYYGSPKSIRYALDAGQSYIIILDRAGAHSIKKYIQDAILIWLYLKDPNLLRIRLQTRNSETQETLAKRLILAKQEMQLEEKNPIFNHHICHEKIENTINQILKILKS